MVAILDKVQTNPVKFGSNWPSDFREVDFVIMFSNICLISIISKKLQKVKLIKKKQQQKRGS